MDDFENAIEALFIALDVCLSGPFINFSKWFPTLIEFWRHISTIYWKSNLLVRQGWWHSVSLCKDMWSHSTGTWWIKVLPLQSFYWGCHTKYFCKYASIMRLFYNFWHLVDAEDTIEKHHQSLIREFKDYQFISGKPYKRMASIYNNIGAVYFEQGNVEKALEYFGKSITQCPYYVQAFYNKAIVLVLFSSWYYPL